MAEKNSIIAFITSLIVGAIAIHIGAILILGGSNFMTALIAALIGSIVWGIAGFFTGWIPLLGSIITFFVWLGSIKILLETGWMAAFQIAIVAWLVSALVVYLLSIIGLGDTDAMGVPGA